jgi:RNA polymerase sigma-70 factor (ECF subfamily)
MDGARIEALYRELGPAIYRRCLKLLRDPAEAQDATQEVFVRAFSHLNSLRPGSTPLPWLYTLATRHCLNRLRDAGRHARANEESLAAEEPAPDLAHALASRNLAGRILARFDERTALIAVHHLVDGMTQEEVAAHLGISRRTVYARLTRFLEEAKALLGEGG